MTGNGASEIGRLATVRMRLTGETFEQACAALEGRSAGAAGEHTEGDHRPGTGDVGPDAPAGRRQGTRHRLRIVE